MTASSMLPAGHLSMGACLWVRDVTERRRADGRPVPPERMPELLEVAALRDQRDLAQRDAAAHQREAAESPRAGRFAAEARRRADDLDKRLRRAWKAFERN